MGLTKEQVESTLKSKLNPSHLEVIDTSGGCGASFAVEIVSEQFEGKRLLERHRLVNSALEEEMKQIHALSIKKAATPEQWKQQESEKSTSTALEEEMKQIHALSIKKAATPEQWKQQESEKSTSTA